MEMNQTEVKNVSEVTNAAQQTLVQELSDFQLAFIGGGVGEVVLA